MNQKFYEEIGSMSEARAKKLIALFDIDPYAQKLLLDYFNGEPLPCDPVSFKDLEQPKQALERALTYLKFKANELPE